MQLTPGGWPITWPRPNPRKPLSVQSRITDEQKRDLYERKITTRALAKILGIHERYCSALFPHKVALRDRKVLMEARKAYKLEIANLVIQGKHTTTEAAKIAFVSYNTMQRFVAKARALNRVI